VPAPTCFNTKVSSSESLITTKDHNFNTYLDISRKSNT